jgi:uncharacterized iron-regulated membrane protein
MIKSQHYYIRKSHRFLGLILGIQFLLWTLGGLYFSWSNMDEIHGDFQKKQMPLLSANIKLVSPSAVIDSIKKYHSIDSLVSIQLIDILGNPYYQIRCIRAIHNDVTHDHHMKAMNHLADATTGNLRGPLNKDEAIQLAKRHFNGSPEVIAVEYLNSTDGHHEYRENPLPAWAVSFKHPSKTTVYIAAELGTIQKFRNDKWRVFDFLWMLHTMDYKGRDNLGNVLLRSFSIFGLFTVFSGFALFFVSSKWFRKKKS